jgi:uroporphyrinogen decarboxylase
MYKPSKRERLQAAVDGHSVDRVPVGLWYHFPLSSPSGRPLAEAEMEFVRKYDPDFLKVMHDLPLNLPDGMERIESPDDWLKLRPLDPKSGNFAAQLETLRILKQNLGQDMPIIDTVFNPFSAANKMCGKRLLLHLDASPEAVVHGLQAIAVSLANYASAWMEAGGDGIFYALDGAQLSRMSEDEYADVFLPLDRIVLQSAMERGTFNVLHLHGANLMFDLVHNLPAHVLNWSSRITYPSLGEARGIHTGCIAGGIDETTIDKKSPVEVFDEARRAIAEAGANGFILAPGCAVPTDTPEENLLAVRSAVEG